MALSKPNSAIRGLRAYISTWLSSFRFSLTSRSSKSRPSSLTSWSSDVYNHFCYTICSVIKLCLIMKFSSTVLAVIIFLAIASALPTIPGPSDNQKAPNTVTVRVPLKTGKPNYNVHSSFCPTGAQRMFFLHYIYTHPHVH